MGCCPQTSVEGCTGSEQWSPSSSAAEVRHSSSIHFLTGNILPVGKLPGDDSENQDGKGEGGGR